MSFAEIILAAAKAAHVSGALLLAICTHESGLTNRIHPSDRGSPTYGVCQVKLDTAKMIGYKGDGLGLMVPEENAKWAAEYLAYQIDRYGDDWCTLTAAYNAGSYNESQIMPGYPRNLKYVRSVQKKLENSLRNRLDCGHTLITEAD